MTIELDLAAFYSFVNGGRALDMCLWSPQWPGPRIRYRGAEEASTDLDTAAIIGMVRGRAGPT